MQHIHSITCQSQVWGRKKTQIAHSIINLLSFFCLHSKGILLVFFRLISERSWLPSAQVSAVMWGEDGVNLGWLVLWDCKVIMFCCRKTHRKLQASTSPTATAWSILQGAGKVVNMSFWMSWGFVHSVHSTALVRCFWFSRTHYVLNVANVRFQCELFPFQTDPHAQNNNKSRKRCMNSNMIHWSHCQKSDPYLI